MEKNGYNPSFDIKIDKHSTFAKSLEFGEHFEKLIEEILTKLPIEVKTDKKYQDTGNLYIETKSRGKQSGINTTPAVYWAFNLYREDFELPTFLFIPTERLKKYVSQLNYVKKDGGDKDGGGNKTSEGYLVKAEDLIKINNVKTVDGRLLNTYSEEYRLYCEAKDILTRYKTSQERQWWLMKIKDKRGIDGYNILRNEMIRLHKARPDLFA
jgi:hypothetical protein